MALLFDRYRLDTERRELTCGAEQIAVGPQVFDLLLYLVRNRDRVVSKDNLIEHVWGGRIVSDSTLTSHVNAVRKAIGDSGEEQRLVRTLPRKGLRFVGEVREDAGPEPPAARGDLHQEVRFCTSSDGVRIAYADAGSGPPLVKAGNWLTHLEYEWESPVWSPLYHRLASDHRLVRYDTRGNGLSDWDVEDISFDSFVRDLESVVDAAGLQRFALFGLSQGCAVSIAYAVRHPERVSRLVLHGGFARGRRKRGLPMTEESDAVEVLMRQGWGRDNPAFRQIFTSLMIPDGSAEQMQWLNDLQRKSASPENAIRIRRAVDAIDVQHLLAEVKVPTLVMHCREDAVHPMEEGRRLAAGIPGARFLALEGRNHVILQGDPGWDRFLAEFESFIRT